MVTAFTKWDTFHKMSNIYRYILFHYPMYEAAGGMDDSFGTAESYEECLEYLKSKECQTITQHSDYVQVYNIITQYTIYFERDKNKRWKDQFAYPTHFAAEHMRKSNDTGEETI